MISPLKRGRKVPLRRSDGGSLCHVPGQMVLVWVGLSWYIEKYWSIYLYIFKYIHTYISIYIYVYIPVVFVHRIVTYDQYLYLHLWSFMHIFFQDTYIFSVQVQCECKCVLFTAYPLWFSMALWRAANFERLVRVDYRDLNKMWGAGCFMGYATNNGIFGCL